MKTRPLSWPLVAGTLVAISLSAPAGADDYDPSQVSWTKLALKASKLGMSVRASVEIREVPKERLAKELLEPAQGTGLMPAELAAEDVVTEPSALFYMLSAADFSKPGESRSLVLYSRDALMRVELKALGMESLRVDYVEESPSGTRKVKGRKDAMRIGITARPLVDTGSEFELLGLRGDVSMYLDPETGAFLQMTGKIKVVGTIHIKLQSVTLK